jgi:hypothetical protein
LVYSSKSFSRRFTSQRYANGVVFKAAIAVDAFEDFVVPVVGFLNQEKLGVHPIDNVNALRSNMNPLILRMLRTRIQVKP